MMLERWLAQLLCAMCDTCKILEVDVSSVQHEVFLHLRQVSDAKAVHAEFTLT